ncbi:hypothetical protein [Sphingomonas nostoxanthinifaciens]|uniref:hypothetical protein n=1 Tax=Sphingomonas nostoxanthinifaciens TaxID=2872652 RepID=UPI001CC2139D|nr:hypothetical protein [Sphingomonas nostoxanthinifaciens]UAK25959.1 hypothetical protein K8P63_07525 [Sphingomonas nostoxanthinifaciens]
MKEDNRSQEYNCIASAGLTRISEAALRASERVLVRRLLRPSQAKLCASPIANLDRRGALLMARYLGLIARLRVDPLNDHIDYPTDIDKRFRILLHVIDKICRECIDHLVRGERLGIMYKRILEAEVRRLEKALMENIPEIRAQLIPQLRRAQLKLDIIQRVEARKIPVTRTIIAL